MKIYVIEPRGTGGMIHYAYQLCQAMAAEGAQVTLVTAENYELGGFPHNFRVERLLKLWPLTDPRLAQPSRNALEKAIRKGFRTARRGVRALRYIHQLLTADAALLRERPDIVQFGEVEFPRGAVPAIPEAARAETDANLPRVRVRANNRDGAPASTTG